MSTAVQPVRGTLVHFPSPLTQHYPTLCLYRPRNTSITMHTPSQSCCTGVCMCTYALRQTPYGHMRKGELGSVCNAYLCICTSPQEHLSFMVYAVLRRPLPCNPSPAHNMCTFLRHLRNTTLLSACAGHIRAFQCNPHFTPLAQASVYILVHYAKHHMDTFIEVR